MPTSVPNRNFILIAGFPQLPSIWKKYDFYVAIEYVRRRFYLTRFSIVIVCDWQTCLQLV